MKIIFFTPSFYPSIGGVEKHVWELSRQLAAGHQVTVITEQSDPGQKTEEIPKIQGFKILRIPGIYGYSARAKKWPVWQWLWEHRQLLDGADILHAHDVHFWLWPYLLSRPGRQSYLTFHGWETKFPIPFKNVLMHRFSDHLATSSLSVGTYISKWYGTSKKVAIYGAVDPIEKISRRTDSLLFLGRLEEDTGFKDYLRIVELLNYPTSKLIIAGKGSLAKAIPPAWGVVPTVYADSRIPLAKSGVVFTGGYLGMLEAMIQKRLVLATYSNQLKHDYFHLHPMSANFLFGSSPEDLAYRYQNLSPDQITAMTEACYNWAVKQSWPALAAKYRKLWNQ